MKETLHISENKKSKKEERMKKIGLAVLLLVSLAASVQGQLSWGLTHGTPKSIRKDVPLNEDLVVSFVVVVPSGHLASRYIMGVTFASSGGKPMDVLHPEAVISNAASIVPMHVGPGNQDVFFPDIATFFLIAPANLAGQSVAVYITLKKADIAARFTGGDILTVGTHGVAATDYTSGGYGVLLGDDTRVGQIIIFANTSGGGGGGGATLASSEPAYAPQAATPAVSATPSPEWLAEVARLYDKHLCREPDEEGLAFFWKRWPNSSAQIERDLTTSREYFLPATATKREARKARGG